MPRRLPARQDIEWSELRRQAQLVYSRLRAGWDALSADEREQARDQGALVIYPVNGGMGKDQVPSAFDLFDQTATGR